MIGDMISKVRTEKGMTKTELAKLTGINIGHITHIEKGERNPSHKALKNICQALQIPYQQLMYTYDKQINEEQETYGAIKHIAYNKVLAIDKLNSFIDCPADMPSASLAIKMPDSSMEPTIKKGSFVFVELNSLLNSKEIGLFSINKKIIIRKFYDRNGKITLKALDKSLEDIKISDSDEFFIIGKIIEN
jgi:transcriptional regulator with XRE-family HTH domain